MKENYTEDDAREDYERDKAEKPKDLNAQIKELKLENAQLKEANRKMGEKLQTIYGVLKI